MKTTYSWRSPLRPVPQRMLLKKAMRDAALLAGLPDGDWEFRIWFLGDRAMAQAHREVMNVPGTTDVITLAYLEEPEACFPGEIALELLISPQFARREGAARADSDYATELMLYCVHGCLHAAGLNDLTPEDRRKMRCGEARVMKALQDRYDFHAIFPED